MLEYFISKNNQKPNTRGFVDRFYNPAFKQTSELSSHLISKKEDLINKTQDSLKKVLKKRSLPYIRLEFVNDRPTPGFITNKINPT